MTSAPIDTLLSNLSTLAPRSVMSANDIHHLRNLRGPQELRNRLEREGVPRTTLSFYRYVRLIDVEALRHTLYQEWEALGVLGRIYLSQEGINAQLSLPTANLDAFRKTSYRARNLPGSTLGRSPWRMMARAF
jgi:hypothetical protein